MNLQNKYINIVLNDEIKHKNNKVIYHNIIKYANTVIMNINVHINQDKFSIKNYHFGSEVTKIINSDKITDEEIKYFKK